MADDNLLFCRSSDDTVSAQDEMWDDTALIKAYDKAINIAKQEVAKRMGLESYEAATSATGTKSKQKAKSQKTQKRWCQGAPCRAVYSEDGILYEATIAKIFDDAKTCIVKFIGYENIEKVDLASLLESEGLQSQIAQHKEAEAAEQNSNTLESEGPHVANGYQDNPMDFETNETKSFKNMYNPGSSSNPYLGEMPPPPPIPPKLMARLPETDEDALSSMLMSWYMSGFHTGYYHGMKQAQSNQTKRRK